jgi:hypothetical protein
MTKVFEVLVSIEKDEKLSTKNSSKTINKKQLKRC